VSDRRSTHTAALIVAVGLVASTAVGFAQPSTSAPPPRSLCLDGVRFVQAGDTARAEKILVANLSDDPTDACALTNLGNLARLRGDLDQARIFYRMAMRSDTTDAGIMLNYATLLRATGDPSADSLYRRALRGSRSLDDILNKLALPRSRESDSLTKASNISEIVEGAGSGGSRRLPNPRLVAMLSKGYDEERTVSVPRRSSSASSSAGVLASNSTGSLASSKPAPAAESKGANELVMASLPLYWKD